MKQYIATQIWRVPKTKEKIKNAINQLIGQGKLPKGIDIDQFTELYYKSNIEKYQQNETSSVISFQLKEIKDACLVFYITNSDNDVFYTNDNPVFEFKDDGNNQENYSGIYFPITPRIICRVYKEVRVRDLNFNGTKEYLDELVPYIKRTIPAEVRRQLNERIKEVAQILYIIPYSEVNI